jgi:hypothetical protein
MLYFVIELGFAGEGPGVVEDVLLLWLALVDDDAPGLQEGVEVEHTLPDVFQLVREVGHLFIDRYHAKLLGSYQILPLDEHWLQGQFGPASSIGDAEHGLVEALDDHFGFAFGVVEREDAIVIERVGREVQFAEIVLVDGKVEAREQRFESV